MNLLLSFYKNCLIGVTPWFNERREKEVLYNLGYQILDYLDYCIVESFLANIFFKNWNKWKFLEKMEKNGNIVNFGKRFLNDIFIIY